MAPLFPVHRLLCPLRLAAHKGNETGCPIISSEAAQMRIGSQQIFVNDAVVAPSIPWPRLTS